MRPEKHKRVPVNPEQQGLSAFGKALSGLDLGPLPSAPSVSPATVADAKPAVKSNALGRVILRRETAHRGGKTVIVIDGFSAQTTDDALSTLAKDLRHAIGTGGTVRERTIEMQGEQAGKIRAFLEKRGYRVAGVS